MEKLSEVMPPQMRGIALSYDEFLIKRVEAYNNLTGNLKYYDCNKCKNKGLIAKIKDDAEVMNRCACMKIRESLKRIEKSGLTMHLRQCTLDNYVTSDEWQKQIKQAAERFITAQNKWFLVCGQSGSGKTHICTAIMVNLIMSGKSGKYMIWREEATKLNANINEQSYQNDLDYLKTVEVLYIDDLFKTKFGAEITQGEIKLAFDLINHRSISGLTTIISTELTVTELVDIDEATASRIIMMAKDYKFSIKKDQSKNYRLK